MNCKSQILLYRSFKKYTPDKHKFTVLLECLPEERLIWERIFGDLYRSLNDFGGLNNSLPKTNDKPQIFSKAFRNKVSSTLKKMYKNNPDLLKQMSDKKKKFLKDNPDFIKKITEKGNITRQTPEYRKNRSDIAKKYANTPERRKFQSEFMKNRFNNPEERKAQSERTKKYVSNPEVRKRLSEQSKKQFENIEVRKQFSDRTKKYFIENPDAAKRHGELMKKRFKENPDKVNCAKKVINTETSEIFYSIKKAAASIGISKSSLSMKLNGITKINDTPFKFL